MRQYSNNKHQREVIEYRGDLYYIPDVLSFSEHLQQSSSWLVVLRDDGILESSVSLKIIDVYVSKGERVRKGTKIMCVETMKIVEHVHSPCNGIVEEVFAEKGKGVRKGEPLAKIKCLE